ncbi:MAG: tetratricopeptide repeat protein [Prevotellaceae bacterium]|jgi:tetratricopeptide (TPR) repeat protein|nr:tetratricopeptide repeat protein [Prevotellaceae bacterium]
MKRIIKVVMTLALAGFFGFAAEAQEEVNKAIELFNQGIAGLESKNYDEAIAKINEAYALVASSPEGSEEVKANLEKLIPQAYSAKAKSKLSNKQFVEAIDDFKEAAEVAKKFNNTEVAADALENIPMAYLGQASQLLDEGKNAEAIVSVDKTIEADSANPQAYLIKGVAQMKLSDNAKAIKTFEKAVTVAKGANNASVETQATNQLSQIYLKDAAAAQKTKKWNDVIKNAEKSIEYKESSNALKLIDLANYQLGASLQATNKAKACEYFKKVKSDPQIKGLADTAIKTLGCK